MLFVSSGSSSGGLSMIILMVAMIALLYFMMIRPQRKEQKRMQAMLDSMEIGDAVVTTGGFYGIIIDITDTDVIVEFGNNKNCRIPMKKEAIAQIEKPEQAVAAKAEKEDKSDKTEKTTTAKADNEKM